MIVRAIGEIEYAMPIEPETVRGASAIETALRYHVSGAAMLSGCFRFRHVVSIAGPLQKSMSNEDGEDLCISGIRVRAVLTMMFSTDAIFFPGRHTH